MWDELLRLFLDLRDPSKPEARFHRPPVFKAWRAVNPVRRAARPDGKIAQFSVTDVFRRMTSLGRL